ncbi:MAG TPA: hypothetical protein V6D17_22125, partial [Candidatus Obscuribacterales bacterium]
KNQTAQERAARQLADQHRSSRHTCEAPNCPKKGKPIPLGELKPAMWGPKRRMRYYHKACLAAL